MHGRCSSLVSHMGCGSVHSKKPPVVSPAKAVVEIVIPAGAVPGTTIQGTTPDGQTVQVKVPIGATPGTRLKVEYTSKSHSSLGKVSLPVAQAKASPKTRGSTPTQQPKIVKVTCGNCGELVEVEVKKNATHSFVCTKCKQQNQFNAAGVFTDGDGEEEVLPPPWWTSSAVLDVPQRSPVSASTREAVQTLMNNTWKTITTRDRKFAKVSKFEVVNVLHNRNLNLWKHYCYARNRIRKQATQRVSSLTDVFDRSSLGEVDSSINEFLLFHGTNPTAADRICSSDFMISSAGSATGALYGKGIYFAECSSKSDEYARDDAQGVYQGLYAMLLCRVTCGNMLVTKERTPNAAALEARTASGSFHSVLGDREQVSGTYREFIVYNSNQAYPEYIIVYRRVDAEG